MAALNISEKYILETELRLMLVEIPAMVRITVTAALFATSGTLFVFIAEVLAEYIKIVLL